MSDETAIYRTHQDLGFWLHHKIRPRGIVEPEPERHWNSSAQHLACQRVAEPSICRFWQPDRDIYTDDIVITTVAQKTRKRPDFRGGNRPIWANFHEYPSAPAAIHTDCRPCPPTLILDRLAEVKKKQGRARSDKDTRPKKICMEPPNPTVNTFGNSSETHEDHGDAHPEPPRSLSESVPIHADGGLRVLRCGVNATASSQE